MNYWDAVRNYHVNSKGWSDIAYSFGVCPHGTRFNGRGWFKNQFANGEDVVGVDNGQDSEWYTVLAFIGIGEAPTPEMIAGIEALIVDGRDLKRCGQAVLPHNAFKVKPCPGPELTKLCNEKWNNRPIGGTSEDDDMPTADEIADAVMARGVLTWAQYKSRSGDLYNALNGALGRNYQAILGIDDVDPDDVTAIAEGLVAGLEPALQAAMKEVLNGMTIKVEA
jgi:hypothetical protein